MPMNKDCIHYESRTYNNGETIRKCQLNLAPNAPFECPKDCEKYKKRRRVGTWDYGSFTEDLADDPKEESKDIKDELKEDPALLSELENIVNSAAPTVIEEVRYSKLPWYKKIFKRKKHGND